MNRETKTFKAGEHEVKAYTYVTGRDLRSIEGSAMNELNLKAHPTGDADITGLTGDLIAKRENEQIKAVIISVDGHKEGDKIVAEEGSDASADGKTYSIIDLVLDMRAEDYDVVMEYVRELTEKKS